MRALKWLVVIMGILIVAATVGLAVALVQRLGGHRAVETPPLALHQPGGSHVGGIAATGDQLAIWVVRPDGERVLLVDPRSGRTTGEIRLGE